jgi:hypothetical protein
VAVDINHGCGYFSKDEQLAHLEGLKASDHDLTRCGFREDTDRTLASGTKNLGVTKFQMNNLTVIIIL